MIAEFPDATLGISVSGVAAPSLASRGSSKRERRIPATPILVRSAESRLIRRLRPEWFLRYYEWHRHYRH